MGYINDRGEFIRSGGTQTSPPSGNGGNNGCGCISIFVLIFVVFCWLQFYNNKNIVPDPNNPTIKLSYKLSCGSPPQSTSQWYAVVGESSALNTIKNNYCGDSYLRQDGLVQVASFSSRQEAENFASQLSQASGYNFWIQ
jgi:hypothetical protein